MFIIRKAVTLVLEFITFVRTDIWRIRLHTLPRKKSFFIKFLRIIILSVRGFDEDRCRLRASALTFYSLISIVPVVAMAFGIAKGFGFEKVLEAQLYERLAGHEEILEKVITFSHSLLESTKGGVLAGIGIVVLFWAVIKVLGQIEDSFNDIWGIRERRPFGRKFSDYLSLMLLCPILIILSSSITLFISTQIANITARIALLGIFSPLITIVVKLLPYCILWVLFTFLYIFMPNTRVRFVSGLVAGIIAGSVFQLVQWGYITFQIGAANYNAIYGSFAALPLFLIWMQLSWLIVLFGAEISFAHQNVHTYEFEPDALQVSPHLKKLLTLQIAHCLIIQFAKGEAPLTATEISQQLEIPIRLVHDIIYELVASSIISDTRAEKEGESAYQPARDINQLTIQSILDALENRGITSIPFAQTAAFATFSESMRSFGDLIDTSPANRLLKDV